MLQIRGELVIFLVSVVTGIMLRLVYRSISIFRQLIEHSLFIIGIEDIIFWLGAALYVFVQIYHTSDGSIRWYFILGVALGVILMTAFFGASEKLYKKIYGRKKKDLCQGLDKKEEKS